MDEPRDLSVLLVEDSESDALLICDSLADAEGPGYRILTAGSLGRAIELAHSTDFDICLLDLGLPDSQGIETIRKFGQRAAHVPVLVLTGFDDTDAGLAAMQEGAQDYLVKNKVHPEALHRTIRYTIERSVLLNELRRSRDRLRRLAIRLENTREEERLRMSREIHDNFGQKLSALLMDMQWMRARLEEDRVLAELPRLRTRLGDSMKLADSALADVQRLAFELRPMALDKLGLAEAIRDEARRFQSRTGIEISVTTLPTLKYLSSTACTTLFRCLQELMTNVARHAVATRVDIGFSQCDHYLVMSVQDNGRGFHGYDDENPPSLGLVGLQERLLAHRGFLRVESEAGRGAKVSIYMPVDIPRREQ